MGKDTTLSVLICVSTCAHWPYVVSLDIVYSWNHSIFTYIEPEQDNSSLLPYAAESGSSICCITPSNATFYIFAVGFLMISSIPEPPGETSGVRNYPWKEKTSQDDSNKLDLQRSVRRVVMEAQPSLPRELDIVPARLLCVTFKRLRQSLEVHVEWKKYHSHLQEGQEGDCGDLMAAQLSLTPWTEYGTNTTRSHVQGHRDQGA